MSHFKDRDGDTWEVAITVGTVARIEAATGLNLGLPDFGNPPLIVRLGVDAPLVARLLWHCCHTSAAHYRVGEDEFYELLTDQTFLDAAAAFREAYRDFFRRRSLGGTGDRVTAALNAIEARMNSGKPSGNGLEPVPSIPAP